jgi:SAM-dependent methyltransferase
VIERPLVYRLWQAPFARRKFAPVLRHNDLGLARRVLDVACGPGTNTGYFLDAEYVGVDLNPDYVRFARGRYGKEFVVADVTELVPGDGRHDFILVNSFLHHVDDAAVRRILGRLRELVAPGGHVHVLELVLPQRRSIARLLARSDRGDHARTLEDWRRLFAESFEEVVCEPYPLGAFGATLWNMVYLKGAVRAG